MILCWQRPTQMNMLLVAAITIGRAYSAYGFSFRHEFRKDPLKITSKNESVKTATAALFKPDESIHAFGSEAVNKYSELKERNQHHAWYFFNEFKISPISKKEGMVMKDINNKAMAAIGVYSKVVGYLKAELMAIITQGNNRLESSDIHWVLTVPGTWNNDARHFMKDVAEKVGIPVSQLSLAIEPGAALLYCMHIPMEAHVDNSYTLDASCIPGNSILVMNYEGGSFDITLFNVRKDNTLRELDNFSKEPNNEIMVTEQFKSMLVKILGSDTMHTFQKDAFSDFDQILREFERKTSTFEYYPHTKLTLTLPFSLLKIYAQKYEENMNTMIDQTEFAGKIRLTGDKLKIETDVLKSMFESSVMHILRKVSELMEQLIYKNIHMIAIVGEFSQSPIFQRILQSALAEKGLKSFCPQNPNLAVLKGAVIFGHSQRRTKDMSTKCSFSFESTVYKKCVDIFTLHAVAEPSSKNKQLKREEGYFSMNIEHRESIVRVCVPSNVNQITGTPDTRINIEVLNKSGWKEHEFLCDMSVMKDGIHITVELKQNEAVDNVIFPQHKSKASASDQAIQYECFERFLDLLDKIVCGSTSLSQNSVLQTLLILIGMETLTGTDPSRIMTYSTALHDFDEPIIISVAIALRLFREAFVVLATHNISFTDIQVGKAKTNGGSFDITLFNVRKDNTLRELDNFSKEPNNEIMVTEQFKSMLVKILGSDTMHTFQKDAFSDFDQILREFERKTSTFEYYPHTKLTLTLPFSLLKIYAQKYEENMNTMIDQTEFAGKIRLTGDKLKIETDVLKSMFESSVMHILRKVFELIEQLIYKNIHMIAIVGEFSQSPIFQRILQSSLAEKRLKSFCPQNPNLAVLKGAVIFGHSQRRTKDMSTKCSFSFESTVYKKCVDIFTLHAVAEPSSKNKQLKREEGYFSMNIEHRESIVRVCVPSNVNQITGTPDTRINIEVLNKSGWKEHEFLCDMSVMKDGIHITVELKQNEAVDNVIFPQHKSKASASDQAIQYECFERFLDLLDKIVCGSTSLSQNSVLQTLLILIGMETLTGTDPSRIMTYSTALHDFDEPIIISVAIALRLFREAFVVLATHNISFTDIQFLVGDELTKKQQERLREEIKEWSSGKARAKLTEDLDVHTKAQIVSAQDDWDVCLNPDHGPALWKCIICDAYFCTSCKAAHMRGKKSRRHFLLHISDRNKEKDVLKEIFCEIHQRELDMFCITDEEVLCCMCTMTKKHILHKMEPLETYVERIRSNVGKALTNADTVFPQYDETIVDLNKKLSSAMEMSTENTKIIDNAFEEAYLKLKQNAEKLKSAEKERIYRIKKSIRADIKSTTIQMTDSKSKLLDSRRFLENCKDKELIQKAHVHINKLRTIEPPQCKSDVSASRISLSDIQSKLQDNLFSK